MNLVVLCDFDGTITTVDTAEWVLAKYALGDWRLFDRQFDDGEISLEECLNRAFSLVKTSEKQILEVLEQVVNFRPNFKKLAEYCRARHVPLIIVSAGIDFVIEHFLKLNNCMDLVEVHSAKTTFNANSIRFTFPPLLDTTSDNFKHDRVRHYQSQGMKVIYVGNGSADYAAVKDADYSFAIKGSRLAKLCKDDGIPCTNMTDFQDIVDAISKILSHNAVGDAQ
jgi:2-hydroxy-3-keto-5-methylthiopentenyl-1-phosphate phosphatase